MLEGGGKRLEASDGADVVLIRARREDNVCNRLESRVEHRKGHVLLLGIGLDNTKNREEDLLCVRVFP